MYSLVIIIHKVMLAVYLIVPNTWANISLVVSSDL